MIEWVNVRVGVFAAYWALISVFAYYYEVIARFVFNSPTNWVHESMFLMYGMQYMLAGAYAYREDQHVRVDVFYAQFSPRWKAIADIITSLFFFIFIGTMFWTGWRFASDAINIDEVSFTEWGVQYWPVKLDDPDRRGAAAAAGTRQADQGHRPRHAAGKSEAMGLDIGIDWLTLLLFGSLGLLLALGLPMAFCTGSLAVIFLFVFGNSAILNMMPSRIFPFMTDYQLSAVPLFIFMAAMLEKAGIIEELFDAVYKWLGSVKGGLAAATVLACTALAAMVGVVGATEVTMGMIALPAMLKRGYDQKLACGSLLAGGTLGILIPPSVMAIVYAVVAQQSLGELLVGSIFPGLLLSALCRLRPGPLLHQSGARTGIAAGGARQPTRETAASEEHDSADPADHPRARYHLRRHRNAGGGGRNRHIRRAVRVGVEPPPHLAGDPGGAIATLKATAMVMWIFFGATMFVGFFIVKGGQTFVADIDPRHRSAALRHPDADDGDPVRARHVPRLGRHPAADRADLPADHEEPGMVERPVRVARRRKPRTCRSGTASSSWSTCRWRSCRPRSATRCSI